MLRASYPRYVTLDKYCCCNDLERPHSYSTAGALVIRNDAKVCNPYPGQRLCFGHPYAYGTVGAFSVSMQHIIMKYSTSTVIMLCQSSMTVNKKAERYGGAGTKIVYYIKLLLKMCCLDSTPEC
jgi:hypothetical protein